MKKGGLKRRNDQLLRTAELSFTAMSKLKMRGWTKYEQRLRAGESFEGREGQTMLAVVPNVSHFHAYTCLKSSARQGCKELVHRCPCRRA